MTITFGVVFPFGMVLGVSGCDTTGFVYVVGHES